MTDQAPTGATAYDPRLHLPALLTTAIGHLRRVESDQYTRAAFNGLFEARQLLEAQGDGMAEALDELCWAMKRIERSRQWPTDLRLIEVHHLTGVAVEALRAGGVK